MGGGSGGLYITTLEWIDLPRLDLRRSKIHDSRPVFGFLFCSSCACASGNLMSLVGKPRLDGTRLIAVVLESVCYGELKNIFFSCCTTFSLALVPSLWLNGDLRAIL